MNTATLQTQTQASTNMAATVSEQAVEIRIAGTLAEYEQAFRIAYEVYYPMGYTEFSPFGLRVTPAQLRPGNAVLLAYHGGQAIATFSLYEDGPDGTPSESFFPAEVQGLRDQGRHFFEFGALMVLPGHIHMGTRICMELFRAGCLFVRGINKKADGICAFVVPKHARFYELMGGFKALGQSQTYNWDGSNCPKAFPMFIDLRTMEENFQKLFEHWGDNPRNMYRFFFKDGEGILCRLRDELSRRDGLDFAALTERFERYLPEALKEKVLES
jgi:hypothetical protein